MNSAYALDTEMEFSVDIQALLAPLPGDENVPAGRAMPGPFTTVVVVAPMPATAAPPVA